MEGDQIRIIFSWLMVKGHGEILSVIHGSQIGERKTKNERKRYRDILLGE